MLNIVIIGQNEGESIEKMLFSLRHINAKRIWVLDRCTDNSVEILKKYNEYYVETPSHLTGRQTSFSRNLGLSHCDINADVIFLDGDRYVVKGDFNMFNNYHTDISLFFIEEDSRDENYKGDGEFQYMPVQYGKVMNGFYSCGIFFKREAINKVLEFQDGKFFNEDIQDVWGIEDTYLGDVCYHLNLTCEFNKQIILHGKFDSVNFDDKGHKYSSISLDVMKRRFELRDKLNAIWS
jgi:hypothetical protein